MAIVITNTSYSFTANGYFESFIYKILAIMIHPIYVLLDQFN